MYSTITLIDSVNQALSLVGVTPVVTSSDNHDSRTMVTLLQMAAVQVRDRYKWSDLLATTVLYNLPLTHDYVVMGGMLGWRLPSQPSVSRVVRLEDNKLLCKSNPTCILRNEQTYRFGFDSTYARFDSTLETFDADDEGMVDAAQYAVEGNTLYLHTANRQAYNYAVTYQNAIIVPVTEKGLYNCTDELVHLVVLCAAANYASTYMPSRKGYSSPAPGLNAMYNMQLSLHRSRENTSQGTTL